jgi:hypothetical protein
MAKKNKYQTQRHLCVLNHLIKKSYDPQKEGVIRKCECKDNTKTSPRGVLNEYGGGMDCLRIRIFLLSGFVSWGISFTKLLSTFSKTIRSWYRFCAHDTTHVFRYYIQKSCLVLSILVVSRSLCSTDFKQKLAEVLDEKWLQERFVCRLAAS